MRALFWFMDELSWEPTLKTLETAADASPGSAAEAVVAFVHAEPGDAERSGKVVTKLVKQLKWLAGKWGTRRVVLHSFSHLGEEKAPPELAAELLDRARERLEGVDYEVIVTPFGYFNDIVIKAPGQPLARIYKDL